MDTDPLREDWPTFLQILFSKLMKEQIKAAAIAILTRLLSHQEYQIDIIFAQSWVDTRLRYNSSSTTMPTLTLNRYVLGAFPKNSQWECQRRKCGKVFIFLNFFV